LKSRNVSAIGEEKASSGGNMPEIINVHAREILDSRGTPTVEAEITTISGITTRASVPSGASTGKYEMLELRDGNRRRFHGKGVQNAVKNILQIIGPEIIGMDCRRQRDIDHAMIELDGTSNKEKLGANAILAVSMACAKAGAEVSGLSLYRYLGGANAHVLPIPQSNILNGGKHADNNLDIQEFMILPVGATHFTEGLRMNAEIFQSLRSVLKQRGLSTSVGDEGGFAPNLNSNEEALSLIMNAVEKAGYTAGKDIMIALDCAASSFYKKGKYILSAEPHPQKSAEEMIQFYADLVSKYPIISIEDGFAEDDWMSWKMLTRELGNKIQIVGDDIFVTQKKRLTKGIEMGIANAILIKLNQIGTVTETLDIIEKSKEANYTCIVSHRSGETEDTFMADFAVATNCGQIKSGSLSRSDRLAKYNQLIRIEEELGNSATYLGSSAFYSLKSPSVVNRTKQKKFQ